MRRSVCSGQPKSHGVQRRLGGWEENRLPAREDVRGLAVGRGRRKQEVGGRGKGCEWKQGETKGPRAAFPTH